LANILAAISNAAGDGFIGCWIGGTATGVGFSELLFITKFFSHLVG
jgi:hypothetical protein